MPVPFVDNYVCGESLRAFLNGETLIHRVPAETFRDAEHLLIEAYPVEGFESGHYSRAMGPAAAGTIESDGSPAGERFHALLQLVHHLFLGGRADVF
jgi:hypothetical protein